MFTHERTVTFEKIWTEIRLNFSHIWIFESVLYVHILKEKCVKLNLNWTWKDIFVEYTTTSKQIKMWSVKTNLIYIVLIYTIDECSRDTDLLENKYILLSLLTYTKLHD